MDDARQGGIAPSLVDLQVNVTIRPLLAAECVRTLIARDPEVRARQVVQRLTADFVGADGQGYAIAEFPGVSDLVDAVGAGVAVVLLLGEVPAVSDTPGVLERLRTAERKARPLDERTRNVFGLPAVLVLEVQARERPQRAVLGLRAGIDLHVGAMPGGVLRDRTILQTLRAVIGRRTSASHVPTIVRPDIAAELDAGIAARDVIVTLTIKRADLHVFDRLGLNGKIGCLCSRYRNQTRCGTKEKTFHHLHLNLQVVSHWEGSGSAVHFA